MSSSVQIQIQIYLFCEHRLHTKGVIINTIDRSELCPAKRHTKYQRILTKCILEIEKLQSQLL